MAVVTYEEVIEKKDEILKELSDYLQKDISLIFFKEDGFNFLLLQMATLKAENEKMQLEIDELKKWVK